MATSTRDVNISVGSDDITDGTKIQRMLIYAKDADNHLHPVNTDTNGHLKITQQDREIQRATTDITTDFSGTALSGTIGSTTKTAYWDAQNYDRFQTIVSGTNGAFGEMTLQSSNTTVDADFVPFQTEYEQGNGPYYFKFTNPDAYQRYWRLVNTSGASITFSVIEVSFLK